MADTSSVISLDDPMLIYVADKIRVDVRQLAKSLTKVQKAEERVDAGAKSTKLCGGERKEVVFGDYLENMQLYRSNIGNCTVMVPSFLLTICGKILENKEVLHILRTPGNARRVENARDVLNKEALLETIPNLGIHDCCQLFKDWVRDLPKPLIPEPIATYMFRAFDESQPLLPLDKGNVMTFLGSFISERARGVLTFISHVLNIISSCHEQNGMPVGNIALVCPRMFTGEAVAEIKTPRAFELPILLMKFLIENPETFTKRLTNDRILNGTREKEISSSADSKPDGVFCVKLPTYTPVQFSAPFKPASPKRKRLEFNIRSPAQGIRNLMEMTAIGSRLRMKLTKRLAVSQQKEPTGQRVRRQQRKSMAEMKAESPIISDKSEVSPTCVDLSPSPARNSSSTLPSTESRFRTTRRLSRSTPVERPFFKTPMEMTLHQDDVEMGSPSMPSMRLVFDEPSVTSGPAECLRCSELRSVEIPAKPAIADSATQFDSDDFEQHLRALQISVSDENRSGHDDDENNADEDFQMDKPLIRMISVMSVIPQGIVAQRRLHMEYTPQS